MILIENLVKRYGKILALDHLISKYKREKSTDY